MNFISKLFKKKEEETEVVSKGSVEEFVTLIRVYYQAVMAVQLGITNLNILNDMALFKRMLKIPTQNNKLGIAEKSRSRKILMQEYGLNENFFKEIDASIKKNCKTQNDIKSIFTSIALSLIMDISMAIIPEYPEMQNLSQISRNRQKHFRNDKHAAQTA